MRTKTKLLRWSRQRGGVRWRSQSSNKRRRSKRTRPTPGLDGTGTNQTYTTRMSFWKEKTHVFQQVPQDTWKWKVSILGPFCWHNMTGVLGKCAACHQPNLDWNTELRKAASINPQFTRAQFMVHFPFLSSNVNQIKKLEQIYIFSCVHFTVQ